MSIILVLGRLRQKDLKFEAILHYLSQLKKKKRGGWFLGTQKD
jgi:hypothetical protein